MVLDTVLSERSVVRAARRQIDVALISKEEKAPGVHMLPIYRESGVLTAWQSTCPWTNFQNATRRASASIQFVG
jgi:hypothetical protein